MDDDDEKRRRRLEKNKIAARECRKRKKEQMEKLEHEIKLLEAENLRLKIKLRVGEEGEEVDEVERGRVCDEIDALLRSNASDADIVAALDTYKEKFSTYGLTRRAALEYHLKHVERILQPSALLSVITTSSTGKVRLVVLLIYIVSGLSLSVVRSQQPLLFFWSEYYICSMNSALILEWYPVATAYRKWIRTSGRLLPQKYSNAR